MNNRIQTITIPCRLDPLVSCVFHFSWLCSAPQKKQRVRREPVNFVMGPKHSGLSDLIRCSGQEDSEQCFLQILHQLHLLVHEQTPQGCGLPALEMDKLKSESNKERCNRQKQNRLDVRRLR